MSAGRLTDAQVEALGLLVRAGADGAGAAPSTQRGRLNGVTANSLARQGWVQKGRVGGRVRYFITEAGAARYEATPVSQRRRVGSADRSTPSGEASPRPSPTAGGVDGSAGVSRRGPAEAGLSCGDQRRDALADSTPPVGGGR